MKYKWVRQVDGMPHVPAQLVGAELAKLEIRKKGVLVPKDVVSAAKPEGSKLHQCFQWNNKKAAEAHRLNQASEILRKITVEYSDTKGEKQTIRAFVNIQTDGGNYYCHTRRLVGDIDLQENVLGQIQAALIAIKNKFAQYKSPKLQKIWAAIDDFTSE